MNYSYDYSTAAQGKTRIQGMAGAVKMTVGLSTFQTVIVDWFLLPDQLAYGQLTVKWWGFSPFVDKRWKSFRKQIFSRFSARKIG
jgi:hypothetical protein